MVCEIGLFAGFRVKNRIWLAVMVSGFVQIDTGNGRFSAA